MFSDRCDLTDIVRLLDRASEGLRKGGKPMLAMRAAELKRAVEVADKQEQRKAVS